MGQAKRNLEATRASFLAELDKWDFPASDWEAETVAEISGLPVVKVDRQPDHVLNYMRMAPKECHVNARFMQDNDPTGVMRQVTGWWVQNDHYVLHSVVDQNGQFACVTPAPLHPETPFDFIPDPKIEWREDGDLRTAYRDGIKVGPGVRANPATALSELQVMRTRLLSGMNPYKALQMVSL